MSKYKFKLVSSLEKIYGSFPDSIKDYKSGSMLKNEKYSFQTVIYADNDDVSFSGYFEIDSPLKDYIKVYRVGDVPCMHTHFSPLFSDDDFISKSPIVLPDPLYPMTDNKLEFMCGNFRTLWFAVEPKGEISGVYPITINIFDKDANKLGSLTHTLNIINAELPEQRIVTTGWFHGDSIASYHNVAVDSEDYWDYLEKYIKIYTDFGYNTIFTPIFTPPLDTDVGAERITNQLIGVTLQNGEYTFDFSALERFINLSHKYGIKYFEISHLFTQWGAEFTPKIMATADGEYKRIFGWDVLALSDKYIAFLAVFLPKLVEFLKQKGIYEKSFFHISDEPFERHLEQYRKLSELVRRYINFDRMIEAISDYEFYKNKLINIPIPSTDHIKEFLDNNVENLWTYYCCCQGKGVGNRFIAMPSYRNRVLGLQLYKYNIKGFLHWGFNFWFSARARKPINPYFTTDANIGEEAYPSGDAFSVYPINESGEPVPSLRLFVWNEALQDMRTLELLEALTDRQTVEELLVDINRFADYPRNNDYYLELREKINKMIEKNL